MESLGLKLYAAGPSAVNCHVWTSHARGGDFAAQHSPRRTHENVACPKWPFLTTLPDWPQFGFVYAHGGLFTRICCATQITSMLLRPHAQSSSIEKGCVLRFRTSQKCCHTVSSISRYAVAKFTSVKFVSSCFRWLPLDANGRLGDHGWRLPQGVFDNTSIICVTPHEICNVLQEYARTNRGFWWTSVILHMHSAFAHQNILFFSDRCVNIIFWCTSICHVPAWMTHHIVVRCCAYLEFLLQKLCFRRHLFGSVVTFRFPVKYA